MLWGRECAESASDVLQTRGGLPAVVCSVCSARAGRVGEGVSSCRKRGRRFVRFEQYAAVRESTGLRCKPSVSHGWISAVTGKLRTDG
ncbi:unnamed protein product [Chondrus crispus]|nr:unnamed protein product [Chondrus crispus]CDF40497.1 unnamed protein product [Chondrus crispus]|eukprot:XP_005710791.1 unnamed protein product [Chondrus crispus]